MTGAITEYFGLLEVGPNLTDVSFLGQGMRQPAGHHPRPNGRKSRRSLVRINGVVFLAGTTIGKRWFMQNREAFMYETRTAAVDEELPGYEVDMLGIVSQYSSDGTGGYQLCLKARKI